MSSDDGVYETTRELLEKGGCDVARCKETPASTFVCHGFVGRCPIDDGVAAAVVTGSDSGDGRPEDGASCAIRRRVPLVVAGKLGDHPYGQWAAAEVRDPQRHLLTAIREVTEGASPTHSDVALRAATSMASRWSAGDINFTVAVHRADDGRLSAHVETSRELAPDLQHSLADTVRGRLRVYDAEAPSIDVSVRTR